MIAAETARSRSTVRWVQSSTSAAAAKPASAAQSAAESLALTADDSAASVAATARLGDGVRRREACRQRRLAGGGEPPGGEKAEVVGARGGAGSDRLGLRPSRVAESAAGKGERVPSSDFRKQALAAVLKVKAVQAPSARQASRQIGRVVP